MSFNYAVALTGSISTGKSTVVEMFKKYGFKIIDADTISHEALAREYKNIAKLFGDEYVKDSAVDRKALGNLIFYNYEKRKILEEILHPIIFDEILQKATFLDKKAIPYIVDIPLFFEGGRYAIESVIVVYASKKQQLTRLMKRENYSKDEALIRIKSQIDIEKKKKNSTYIIDNTQDMKHLAYEVEKIKDKILGDFL